MVSLPVEVPVMLPVELLPEAELVELEPEPVLELVEELGQLSRAMERTVEALSSGQASWVQSRIPLE